LGLARDQRRKAKPRADSVGVRSVSAFETNVMRVWKNRAPSISDIVFFHLLSLPRNVTVPCPVAGSLRYFADKFGKPRASIEGTQVPYDALRPYATVKEGELIYNPDSKRSPLVLRRRVEYHGFELEREIEPVDEFPPELADKARHVLAEALDYLAACDVRDIQAHVQGMTTAMMERLEALRVPTLTPADPARHGASVCVASPRAQAIAERIARRGVLAWNGQGRIRFSFHGYNSRHDVDQAIEALNAEWA